MSISSSTNRYGITHDITACERLPTETPLTLLDEGFRSQQSIVSRSLSQPRSPTTYLTLTAYGRLQQPSLKVVSVSDYYQWCRNDLVCGSLQQSPDPHNLNTRMTSAGPSIRCLWKASAAPSLTTLDTATALDQVLTSKPAKGFSSRLTFLPT